MVLAGQTHSFDEICTFHTLAPDPDRQSWTVGLARSSREIGSEEVLDDLRYGIAVAAWQKPEFFSLIQAATPSKTSDVRERALEFLSTVNATFVRDAEDPKSEPDWLVTAHPITHDYEKQQNILTFLRSLPISHGDSSFTWAAHRSSQPPCCTLLPIRCGLCGMDSHLAHNCPFPCTFSWKGAVAGRKLNDIIKEYQRNNSGASGPPWPVTRANARASAKSNPPPPPSGWESDEYHEANGNYRSGGKQPPSGNRGGSRGGSRGGQHSQKGGR
ncbi:hypothetical protein Moror_15769 [Moniliophthora roreri MCA 2997]|uniref:Uncharacterized protein n=1 Tax=Moniliophthora roreri (strain MCA 2997) TaxID=1381753 RepID=V2W1X2_MONRO|nr:hypothetical protein Moror_15769 [Moniliophthora roreri MCA 2997]